MITSTRTEDSPYRFSSMRSDIRPESSSNSTTFIVAPTVPSATSLTSSSMAPVSMDTKCQASLHDSTISRLIDAVSLGDDQDTRGSISALIGQFNITADQKDLMSSPDCTSSRHSNYHSNSALKSPFNTTSTSNNYLISSQKERPNPLSYSTPSPCISNTNPLHQKNLSSPETADLEEVYTILDEEVLLPVSVYNLKKQTAHVQADTTGSTPSHSLGSSPTKAFQGFEKGHNMGWNVAHNWGGSKGIEETEESVYEEVYDPLERIMDNKSKTPMTQSLENRYHFPYDSTQNGFTEVEINVDEDPLERILNTPQYGSPWKRLTSPTKRHAIYQNNESSANYFHPAKSAPVCDRQQPVMNKSHLSYLQCLSPVNKSLYIQPDHYNPTQTSSFHQSTDSRPYASSPIHYNSYLVPQSNPETRSYPIDTNRNFTQTEERDYHANHLRKVTNHDRKRYKEMEAESLNCQYDLPSSENLTRQSAMPSHNCRDFVSSPPSHFDHLLYDCMTPTPESSSIHKPSFQSDTLSQTNQASLGNNKQCSEARYSLQPSLGLSMACSQSSHKDSSNASQVKSKSLGDLTSEDISCNFQGKYHIISRSFVTSKTKKMGLTGVIPLQSQSCDPLTEQLRKLVSLEGDDSNRIGPEFPHQETNSPVSHTEATNTAISPTPRNEDDSPPLLTRRLSSRSQSRVRNINNRARERQQEALRPRAGELLNSSASIGGVVLRNKASMLNPPANRHSTGSYIAGYLSHVEDRGLPEGACTSLRYGYGDHYRDNYHTDDSLVPPDSSQSVSEPEVYFLLRL